WTDRAYSPPPGRARLHLRRYGADRARVELETEGQVRGRCRRNVEAHRLLARRADLDPGLDRESDGRLVQIPWTKCGLRFLNMAQNSDKIRSLQELGKLAAQTRAEGRK